IHCPHTPAWRIALQNSLYNDRWLAVYEGRVTLEIKIICYSVTCYVSPPLNHRVKVGLIQNSEQALTRDRLHRKHSYIHICARSVNLAEMFIPWQTLSRHRLLGYDWKS
ncbi:hypothetical protein EMCRGX_G019606, partial [Ephydatia muelleri]